jgi:C1A family cysteine protease
MDEESVPFGVDEKVLNAIQDVGEAIQDVGEAIQDAGEAIHLEVSETIQEVGEHISNAFIKAISFIDGVGDRGYIRVNHPFNLRINRVPRVELKFLKIQTHTDLPAKVDLREKFPPVYDQGSLGSCTANALCGVMGYNDSLLYGSRLFVYYNARKIEGTIEEDAGATLTDCVYTLEKYGVCQEREWEYDISKFAVCPPPKCYASALNHQALQVKNIENDIYTMKNALAQGYPFVVGILIYKSFETIEVARTGMVPMPTTGEDLLGGHAVVCVGYDDERKLWIMRNSWGVDWGDNGYFYLPYLYLLDSSLASDLWNIIKIEMTADIVKSAVENCCNLV